MSLVRPATIPSATTWTSALFVWGPIQQVLLHGGTAVNTLALNDADNAVASIFMVPKDGTLDRIGVPVSGKAGTSTTVKYTVGYYTIDASGFPTTTAHGSMVPATPAVNDFTNGTVAWVTLATGATVQAGQIIAAVIKPEGIVNPDGSNNISVRRSWRTAGGTVIALPYEANFQTAWAKQADIPQLAARYSDGEVVAFMPPSPAALFGGNVNTGTTPDEVGAQFSVPWDVPCVGARVQVDVTTLATNAFEVRLYDAAGTQVRSAVIPAATIAAATMADVPVFWDSYTLTADVSYRLTVLPTTTDSLTIAQLVVPDTDSKNSICCGDRWRLTTRADAGAWTETTNTIPLFGVILKGSG
jgi:hypothetical protein